MRCEQKPFRDIKRNKPAKHKEAIISVRKPGMWIRF